MSWTDWWVRSGKRSSGFSSNPAHVASGTLTAIKPEDTSRDFGMKNSEIIFTIAMPYMYDAADEEFFAIDIETAQGEINCMVTSTSDATCLSRPDRVDTRQYRKRSVIADRF